MTIEITDNRQEWLIKLGEELAVAVREEQAARESHEEAYRRVRKIQKDIASIGGYIVDRRKEESEVQ